MVAKVIEQEVFPSEVLKARVRESSKAKRVDVDPDNTTVDGDAAVDTYNVTPPPTSAGIEESPPTGSDAPPTERSNAPPTSLPLNHHTTSTHDHAVSHVNDNNHVI